MKLKIEQSSEFSETEIIIKCKNIDSQIQKIINLTQISNKMITVQIDGAIKIIKPDSVYYFESVDEKCFVYCRENVYSTEMKLYEIEEMLKDLSFVRISKSCILNIDFLESVKILINGKMEALLSNNEKVIINRHYVPQFKKKFGL